MNRFLLLFFFSVSTLFFWVGGNMTDAATLKNVEPVSSAREAPDHPVTDLIRVGYFIAPPHVFRDEKTRELRGAIYDLMESHIAPEIGVKFQWDTSPTTIPRQLYSLKSTEKYIACLLTFAPERLEYSLYSQEPYFFGQSIVAVHKSNPLKEIKKASDISHMVFGYSQHANVTPFMRDPTIKLDKVENPNYHEINLEKTLRHRIDGIYTPNKASTIMFLQEYGVADQFRLIDLPEKPVPFHVLFSKDLKEVAEKFDRAFEKFGGRKLYLEILSTYIDVSKLQHISEKPE